MTINKGREIHDIKLWALGFKGKSAFYCVHLWFSRNYSVKDTPQIKGSV